MTTKDRKLYRAIGAKIRELRVSRGESQPQLGKVLRRQVSAVSSIENGKQRTTLGDVILLCAHYGVKPHVFFPLPKDL